MMKLQFHQLMLVTHKYKTTLPDYLLFIEACVKNGVSSVQLRQKQANIDELISFGLALKKTLSPYHVPLIVNDHLDVAVNLNAEGLHLGQDDGDVLRARNILGPKKIIGLTVNSLDELQKANHLPINYVGVGAIFQTANKPNVRQIWGCKGLSEAVSNSNHPVIAIGGIDEKNLSGVLNTNVHGIAAIGAFHNSPYPEKTTQSLANSIKKRNRYA
jgi:thiamine-phosphate pyrophosphorylase